jgi:hypothetical protein
VPFKVSVSELSLVSELALVIELAARVVFKVARNCPQWRDHAR